MTAKRLIGTALAVFLVGLAVQQLLLSEPAPPAVASRATSEKSVQRAAATTASGERWSASPGGSWEINPMSPDMATVHPGGLPGGDVRPPPPPIAYTADGRPIVAQGVPGTPGFIPGMGTGTYGSVLGAPNSVANGVSPLVTSTTRGTQF